MEQRAASMAQMAKRANNPQDIQAMQQRLTMEIQNGTIKPYIGIPLIQELTKRLGEAKAKAAMNVMGAQAPAQGGAPAAPAAPIAQQVMQQATQESQGLEALPSNLPQSYAGGGIIAFEDGGEVERYQNEGSTGTTPAGRYVSGAQQQVGNYFSGVQQQGAEYEEKQRLRNELISKYGPSAGFTGLFKPQSDADRQAAQNLMLQIDKLSLPQLQALSAQGPSALSSNAPPVAEPYVLTETDARLQALHGNKNYYGDGYGTTYDKGNVPQAKINSYMQANKGANQLLGMVKTGGGAGTGGGGQGRGNAPAINAGPAVASNAGIEQIKPPTITSFADFMGDLPKKMKDAAEVAVNARKKELEELDNPLFKAQEDVIAKREGRITQDSKVAGLMALARAGLRTAAGTSRNALQNIATGLEGGLDDLIKAEAAKRASMEKAEDARMNLTAQKNAAAKGNMTAADAAGARRENNIYQAAQLNAYGKQHDDAAKYHVYSSTVLQRNADVSAATQLKATEISKNASLQIAQIQAAHHRQYNELIRQGQLDAKVAQTLLEAEKNFMTAQGMNYIGKPEELSRDARAHALNAAKVYLPGANLGNAPSLPSPTADIYKNRYGITPTQP
jgi:hypothetical protein